jgi:TonB family protein
MTQPWRHLEGQVIGGKFRLTQYLGGSDHSAVLLTERGQGEPRKAAIKFVAANPEKAARQLSRWAEAEKLSHPNLLRLFEMGQCRVKGEDLLYLVMEYAEENLSQVVASRPLTPSECQAMLPPLLEALAYVHRQGFVHGRLKPSSIMAAGERLKISSDGLVGAGEAGRELGAASVYDPPEAGTEGLPAAGDVWSLGMTLAEVLTQKVPLLEAGRKETLLPRSVPAVLADVVRHCLSLDPKQRWTVEEIAARLSPVAAASPTRGEVGAAEQSRGRKRYVAAAVAVAVLGLIFIAGRKITHTRHSAEPTASVEAQAPAADDSARPAQPSAAAEPAPAPVAKPATGAKVAAGSRLQQAIVREVLPKVPKSARDTIQGTIRVRVRVALDQNGNVAGARFDSTGPSKYFARLSMQAAQGWKFAPPQPQGPNPAKQWLLQFQFRRDTTRAIPTPLSR